MPSDRLDRRSDQQRVDPPVVSGSSSWLYTLVKIAATITNAQVYLDMAEKGEDFSDYVWGFVGNKPVVNQLDHWKKVQPKTPLSEAIAKDMKKRGFRFVGPTTMYALMQSVGIVNDHTTRCFRYVQLGGTRR